MSLFTFFTLFTQKMKHWNLDINWLLSTWRRLLNWKGPGPYARSSKLFKRFLKIFALVYIYELAKYVDLMSCGSKDVFKKASHALTDTHHDVTDLVNRGMVKNTKIWISWDQNITFLWNKKILDLCLKLDILRIYRFVVEVTFKKLNHVIVGADFKKRTGLLTGLVCVQLVLHETFTSLEKRCDFRDNSEFKWKQPTTKMSSYIFFSKICWQWPAKVSFMF